MGMAIWRPLRPQVVLVLLGLSWCHLQTASACKAGHVADGSSHGLVAFRRLTEHPTVSAEAVQAALKRIAGVGWHTPPVLRTRGVTYAGDGVRLARLVGKLLEGHPVTVATLGGSITYGVGVRSPANETYGALLVAWLQRAFPPRTGAHTLVNAGVRGTTSSYMSLCLDMHLPQGWREGVDWVFLEYAVNDPPGPYPSLAKGTHRAAMERLMRKLLGAPSAPLLTMLHFNAIRRDMAHTYWGNAERDFHELATYYGAPTLSVKAATHHAMREGLPGLSVSALYGDHGSTHPSAAAHVVAQELAATLMVQGMVLLALGEEGGWGTLVPDTPALPPPVIPNNYEAPTSTCWMEEAFKARVSGWQGWEWTDEGLGPGKLGWVTRTVGASLTFDIDTRVPEGNTHRGPVVVSVAHLKSYAHMGTANISCVSGCMCGTVEVEGWYWRQVSITSMADVLVTQHPSCRMAVAVVPRTRSKEHKFKVMGATVSSEAGGHTRTGLIKYMRDAEEGLSQGGGKGGGGAKSRLPAGSTESKRRKAPG